MTKNQRMSNFELLRIVAMVLIIIHHLVVHCFEVQLTTESSIEQFNNGWYNNPVFYPILFLPEIFNPLGKAGVAIFMLLSGYFLVERGKTVNLGKIASKLLGMIAFAVVLVTVGITVWQAIHPDPDIKLPIFELHAYNWWFVGYYLIAVIAGKPCAAYSCICSAGTSKNTILSERSGRPASSWPSCFFAERSS